MRLHGAGSRTIHRHAFLDGLFHCVPLKCIQVSVIYSRGSGPCKCCIASTGSVFTSFLKGPTSAFVNGATSSFSERTTPELRCLLRVIGAKARGRVSVYFRLAGGRYRIIVCSPRGGRIITLFLSAASSMRARLTLSRDRGLFGGVFTGVPTKIRVCSGSKFLMSVGGGSVRVFKIHSGRSIVKIGLFRGPGISTRLTRHVRARSVISFHLGCTFSQARKCCSASGRPGSIVRLCAGIDGICSDGNGFANCTVVGVSGARQVSTVDHVYSFRGFFLLVSSCTGMNCTGLGLLSQGNCTVGR